MYKYYTSGAHRYRNIIMNYTRRFILSHSVRGSLSKHRCKTISLVVSFVLLCINLFVWHLGCQHFQSPIDLPHGYMPVFPHHLYPPKHFKSSSSADSLDHFLHSHIVHDSLNQSVPPVVHIVHCDIGPFTFTHYMSVLATFKVLKPSAMYLHLKAESELDPDGYYQFLPELVRDIPILTKVTLKEYLACSSNSKKQADAYINIIGKTGGFAVNSRTLLSPSESITSLLNNKLSVVMLDDAEAMTMIVSQAPQSLSSNSHMNSSPDQLLKCHNPNSFSSEVNSSKLCVYLEEDIFPFQIFNANTDFAHLARWIGYGTSDGLFPKPSKDDIVPNIVHYVWLGKRNLDYFTYLSFLSSLYVLEADAVYVHGEAPLGELWTRFKKEPRVKLILRDFPDAVYGEPIKKYVSHASDYLRADILLRYGGVYADTDVIFLRKLPPAIRRYNTSACVDWPRTGAFPDVFNMGVLTAAPGATYLRYFMESYRWYLDDDWSYNAIHIPYKVYEKKPQTLHIARHLQVLCAEDKCHATWVPGYKQDGVDHLDGKTFDWKKDAFSIHWTHPDPKEFTSQEALLSTNSITADIGKMVLRKAKII